MKYYQETTEAVEELDINTPTPVVIYSVFIPSMKVGDILNITSEFEVTNASVSQAGGDGYRVTVGSSMIIADSAVATTGTIIDQDKSYIVTTDMHHSVIVKALNYRVDTVMTDKYINVVAYADDPDDDSSPGEFLVVEQNYGHLDVVQFVY